MGAVKIKVAWSLRVQIMFFFLKQCRRMIEMGVLGLKRCLLWLWEGEQILLVPRS